MIIFTTFVLLFAISSDATAEEYPVIQFTMTEEEPTAYPVGSIANKSRPFLTTTDYDNLVYEFFPSEYETIFTLGDESGVLYTSVVIDRETVCEFKTVCELVFDVLVRTRDGTYTQPITVKVIIEDKNDNSPIFPKQSVTLVISEGSHTGSAYSIDTAMDSDFGANNSIQSYHLEAGPDSAGIFELNVTKDFRTFSLKLILLKILDRETRPSYTMKIVARDGGNPPNTGFMDIHVIVKDTNDNPPIFTKPLYNVTVNESIPIQETILKLSANDADADENADISFRIREFQENRDAIIELFSLVESTGEIKVKSDLTLVAGQSYKFIVEAIDHGSEPQSSQAEVLIHIHDSGNNAPEVTVSLPGPGNRGFANISESSPNGSFVASVYVIDTDSGLNGEVYCDVDNQHFGIESFGGNRYKVVVRSVLDREVKDVHSVVVTCSDKGTPQMSGTVSFRVSLDDKNDNKPVFEKNLYTARLKENENKQKTLIQVSATDADKGSNSIIHYAVHADALNQFVIDNNGVITAVEPFDREKALTVTFRVLAIDSGDTPLTGTATVVVSVDDENDIKPKFNKTVNGFEVYENQPTGTDIATLAAYDLDEGINAEFDFAISPDYLDRVPFVVFSNGLLKANKMLDREETSRYDFVVVVTDHGTVPLSSSAHVTIVVKDLNDNPPTVNFPKPLKNDTVTLQYPGFENEHVAYIDAYDVDDGLNKELEYSIKSGNDMGIFDINKDTGEIYFDSVVDIGSDQVATLKINVSDKGSPKLSTLIDLFVHLKYTNATFVGAHTEDSSTNVIIAVVVVLVTLAVSGGIIALIFFLRTLDKKKKNKKDDGNDSDFGFAGSGSHTTIMSTESLSLSPGDPSRDLIKKKEVSFILDTSDSLEYHQQKPESSLSSLPGKSSLRYQPSFTPSVPDRTSDLATTTYSSHERLTPNTLDSRELQEKANEQLHTIKLQQTMLQNRAKQWIQQQQQQFGPVHHDDHHSETSAETIGSDSGRGGSEEDEVTSSPSADDPKTFDLSSPESQHYYLSQQTDMYTDTQNKRHQSSYNKQPWSRKPHLAQRDHKNSHNTNRNYNFLHPDSVPNSYNSYASEVQNSWGQPYFSVAGPMDFTGDSALHSFFDRTPVGIMRDDDDNYSTTTSGSYTLYSEEIL